MNELSIVVFLMQKALKIVFVWSASEGREEIPKWIQSPWNQLSQDVSFPVATQSNHSELKAAQFDWWRRMSPNLTCLGLMKKLFAHRGASQCDGDISPAVLRQSSPFLMTQSCKQWCYKMVKTKCLHSEGSTWLPLNLHYGPESMNMRQEVLKITLFIPDLSSLPLHAFSSKYFYRAKASGRHRLLLHMLLQPPNLKYLF